MAIGRDPLCLSGGSRISASSKLALDFSDVSQCDITTLGQCCYSLTETQHVVESTFLGFIFGIWINSSCPPPISSGTLN